MELGNKLLELRKSKGLSQEELAEKLNVTRQTVSKWETNQSTPDIDKIVCMCDLYQISTDELLRDKKEETKTTKENIVVGSKSRAFGIAFGIFMYFVAIASVAVGIVTLKINPVLCSGLFLLLIGVGTCIIVFTCLSSKNVKKFKDICVTEQQKKDITIKRSIKSIIFVLILLIYIIVSSYTRAWYITWILWIVFILMCKIVDLIIGLRGAEDEEEK